jgi:hypothetical protein
MQPPAPNSQRAKPPTANQLSWERKHCEAQRRTLGGFVLDTQKIRGKRKDINKKEGLAELKDQFTLP